jgi:S-adenosylmethionine-dependent methyltransferase
MIHEERIIALKDTWNMLKPGALWVVIDTPNRLWFFDEHTSALPFFHWLPDELAFKYSKFSPRKEFSEIYREYSKEVGLHFLRRGRGLSFHEFDLAIGNSKKLNVVSSKKQYEKYSWIRTKKIERRYKRILKNVYPGLHEGFYEKNLELIIMKK